MDLYRIVKTDKQYPGKSYIRYGPRSRVWAIVRQVKDVNAGRVKLNGLIESGETPAPPGAQQLVDLKIEGAIVPTWKDVTDFFMGEE